MRPVENYALVKTELVELYGKPMAQLLDDDDFLDSPNGADYSKLLQTFNNFPSDKGCGGSTMRY